MTTLSDKTVLLTGATGGIGRHLARALVSAKANVVCMGRSVQSLQKLQAELIEASHDRDNQRISTFPFDLQHVKAIPALVREIEQSAGPIDILINNAAVEKFRSFQDYTLADVQGMTATNLLAPMMLCHSLLPSMLDKNSGHIVNISSGAGKHGAPFNSVYSATKAALINWSEGLRLELADCSINVSVVCPGITDAGMFHALETEAPEGMKVTPPSEVAEAVLQAILNNQPEVMLDGLQNKVFVALSQFSPQLSDHILRSVGIVETNRDCAYRLMRKEHMQEEKTQEEQVQDSHLVSL